MYSAVQIHLYLTDTMQTQERDQCIDKMANHLFSVMQECIKDDRNEDALAICEEWMVDGKDPQDEDTEYIFIPNITYGDWTWDV